VPFGSPSEDPAIGAPAGEAIRAEILAAIDAEARLAAGEGVASEADIDLAMRLGASHPVGPFERARSRNAPTQA
jgi:3-hydroxybutyryl-CoA dehydrogenase